MKRPWVSGLWLDCWGSNARALFRPTLYTRQALQFSLCGTMFPAFLIVCMTHGAAYASHDI